MPTLRELRQERGLTQRDLARLASVSMATMLSVERGRGVGIAEQWKLAQALGVDPSDIDWPVAVSDGRAEG